MSEQINTKVAVMELRVAQLESILKSIEEKVAENSRITRTLHISFNVAKAAMTLLLPVIGYLLSKKFNF